MDAVMGPRMRYWWESLSETERMLARDAVRNHGIVDRRVLRIPIDFGTAVTWDDRGNFVIYDEVAEFIEKHAD